MSRSGCENSDHSRRPVLTSSTDVSILAVRDPLTHRQPSSAGRKIQKVWTVAHGSLGRAAKGRILPQTDRAVLARQTPTICHPANYRPTTLDFHDRKSIVWLRAWPSKPSPIFQVCTDPSRQPANSSFVDGTYRSWFAFCGVGIASTVEPSCIEKMRRLMPPQARYPGPAGIKLIPHTSPMSSPQVPVLCIVEASIMTTSDGDFATTIRFCRGTYARAEISLG